MVGDFELLILLQRQLKCSIIMNSAGMSIVNSRVSSEEGGTVTVECLYSERYRYSTILLFHFVEYFLYHINSNNPTPVNLKNTIQLAALTLSPVTVCQQRK